MHTQRRAAGLTALEVIVIVAFCLLAIVAAAPRFAVASQRAKRNAIALQVRIINDQIELHRREHAGAPPALVAAAVPPSPELSSDEQADRADESRRSETSATDRPGTSIRFTDRPGTSIRFIRPPPPSPCRSGPPPA